MKCPNCEHEFNEPDDLSDDAPPGDGSGEPDDDPDRPEEKPTPARDFAAALLNRTRRFANAS